MPETPFLSGRYVDLRPLVVADAEITHGWRLSSRARLLNAAASDVAAQAAWIAGRPDDEYNFVIQLKSGVPVGMYSLSDIDLPSRRGEPGRFLIGDEAAVRGVPAAVEATRLLYEFAFETLGLERLFGLVVADNKRMVKWQKYVGMQEEGVMRRHLFLDGEFRDAVMMSVLRDEYHSAMRARLDSLIKLADASSHEESKSE